ncbi:unnamed protein product [Rotaria sp. Silwood2]|nr:unnamed protein product [Rotaria sp. Silwood2]CAF2639216.1 unnamed protein product [Rotaria sp. Silwood2]CAF2972573.1 unnamed protein product [Rotaria sp. Silwood2]CAF3124863.1 unnamed protein product [Rotaria sp. Silwood2]CAF3914241.1 unnamed protein product [Rotaria sp. Silwood2]
MFIFCFLSFVTVFNPSVGYSQRLFASDFRAPQPPDSIVAEYQASYVQHKWDGTGISHIGSGMIYASLSLRRLRMDVTYGGVIASSFFDYANANSDGTIPNYIYTLSPSAATAGSCTFYNVTPAYPLFPPNILAASSATFAGLVTDNLFYANQEPLQAWDILFGGTTSVTAFLDKNNTVVRMDFSSPSQSTFTTTRLFNIIPGSPAANLFSNPCPPGSSTPAPISSGGSRTI